MRVNFLKFREEREQGNMIDAELPWNEILGTKNISFGEGDSKFKTLNSNSTNIQAYTSFQLVLHFVHPLFSNC